MVAKSSYAMPPVGGFGCTQVGGSNPMASSGNRTISAEHSRTVPPWRLMTPEEAAQSNRPPGMVATAVVAPAPSLSQPFAGSGGVTTSAEGPPPPSAGNNIGAWLSSLGLSQYEHVVATQYDDVEQIVRLYRSSIAEFFEDC